MILSKITLLSLLLFAPHIQACVFNGHHQVLVPSHLQSDAMTVLEGTLELNSEGRLRIHYTLPMDLTGPSEADIDVRGSLPQDGSLLELTGPLASALCRSTLDGNWDCFFEYQGLLIDETARSQDLTLRFGNDPVLLEKKLQIAARFSKDSVGILRIPAACRSENLFPERSNTHIDSQNHCGVTRQSCRPISGE